MKIIDRGIVKINRNSLKTGLKIKSLKITSLVLNGRSMLSVVIPILSLALIAEAKSRRLPYQLTSSVLYIIATKSK